MNQDQTHKPQGDEGSPLDDLRDIAFDSPNNRPPQYPKFDIGAMIRRREMSADERRSHPRVTERVRVWLDALGSVFVEWSDALLPPNRSPAFATRSTDDTPIERRVLIESQGTHQPTLELVIIETTPRSLVVRVGEWPHYVTDVRVRATASNWLREGSTNAEGEVRFTDLPPVEVGAIQVELILAGN